MLELLLTKGEVAMNVQTAQYLQKKCQELNAIGVEVWYVGLRFHLKDGKLSKIYSRKGLDLIPGDVWINTDNFDSNRKKLQKKVHPDHAKDSKWATRLSQHINEWTEVIQKREITRILLEASILDDKLSCAKEYLMASRSSRGSFSSDLDWDSPIGRTKVYEDESLQYMADLQGY